MCLSSTVQTEARRLESCWVHNASTWSLRDSLTSRCIAPCKDTEHPACSTAYARASAISELIASATVTASLTMTTAASLSCGKRCAFPEICESMRAVRPYHVSDGAP